MGYGLFADEPGDYVPTTMTQATGHDILTELVGHLGYTDTNEISETTTVIPAMMPYITTQFAPRCRQPVVPAGSANFALLGQYVEIPEAVVFTVEYSARAAMHAVYDLLRVDKPIPGVYHGRANPKVAVEALATALG